MAISNLKLVQRISLPILNSLAINDRHRRYCHVHNTTTYCLPFQCSFSRRFVLFNNWLHTISLSWGFCHGHRYQESVCFRCETRCEIFHSSVFELDSNFAQYRLELRTFSEWWWLDVTVTAQALSILKITHSSPFFFRPGILYTEWSVFVFCRHDNDNNYFLFFLPSLGKNSFNRCNFSSVLKPDSNALLFASWCSNSRRRRCMYSNANHDRSSLRSTAFLLPLRPSTLPLFPTCTTS